MRDARAKGDGAGRAGVDAPDADATIDKPKTTRATSGRAKPGSTPHTPPATSAPVATGPGPPPADGEVRALGGLLRRHVRLCQAGATTDARGRSGPARRVAAMRKGIGDRLALAGPGSKAAKFLRGLRVLVEVESIAPGHAAGLRREAERRLEHEGWETRVSLAERKPGHKALDRVSLEYGVEAEALKTDLRFAEAVEVIARNCKLGVFALMLEPGGCLEVSEVVRIGRKGPERQRYEVDRATRHAERHAKGRYRMKGPEAGDWPMDTRDFAKVPGRIGRAFGNVLDCIQASPSLLKNARPTEAEREAIRLHLHGIVDDSGRLLRHVQGLGTGEPVKGEKITKVEEKDRKNIPGTLAKLGGNLKAAHYFVEKTARDVPRFRPELRPSLRRSAQIREMLAELIVRTRELTRMIEDGLE